MAQKKKRELKKSDIKIETVMVVAAYALMVLNVLCAVALFAGHVELVSWLVFFMDPSDPVVPFLVIALAIVWLYFGVIWTRDLIRHKKLLAEKLADK